MRSIILLIAFVLLGVITLLLNKYARPKQQKSSANQFDASAETESPKTTDSPNHQRALPDYTVSMNERCTLLNITIPIVSTTIIKPKL